MLAIKPQDRYRLKTSLKTNNKKRAKYPVIWKEKEWKLIRWLAVTNPYSWYSCPSCIGLMGWSRNLFSKDTWTEEEVLRNLALLSWFWPFVPSFGLGLLSVDRCGVDVRSIIIYEGERLVKPRLHQFSIKETRCFPNFSFLSEHVRFKPKMTSQRRS